jgi:adenylosuccinate synthase
LVPEANSQNTGTGRDFMTVHIVTDLGYGDSGKGTTVDHLSRLGSTVVIRHNGGAQAGHNVTLPDGTHHEFSQFGAGTLAGAATFLSEYMLVNPLNMMNEATHLRHIGVNGLWDRTFVDENAKIITPWHIDINRVDEMRRGVNRHGSCGEGIGACVQQDLHHPELTVRVKDLFEFDLEQRLEHLHQRLIVPYGYNSRDLAQQYRSWARSIRVVGKQWLRSRISSGDNLIFEGAQGVLLDEWHGFHPYTTWSTTTHDNALSLLKEAGYTGAVERLGVVRAYMTRHGAGPFVTEDASLQYDEPHNVHSPWQGAFRQGHLDLVALRYAVDACGGVDGLVVTHLDRSEEWKVANQYVVDGRTVNKLHAGHERDLERQNKLTRLLMRAQPVYSQETTEELLSVLNGIAPVRIASYGPTYTDKDRQEIYL